MKLSLQLNIVPTGQQLPPELVLIGYDFKYEIQPHISEGIRPVTDT